MDAQKVELEMRLAAIEYLLCDLYAKVYLASGVTDEMVAARHADLIDMFSKQTFPTLHPVQSDVGADLLREAVERLLRLLSALREEGKQ